MESILEVWSIINPFFLKFLLSEYLITATEKKLRHSVLVVRFQGLQHLMTMWSHTGKASSKHSSAAGLPQALLSPQWSSLSHTLSHTLTHSLDHPTPSSLTSKTTKTMNPNYIPTSGPFTNLQLSCGNSWLHVMQVYLSSRHPCLGYSATSRELLLLKSEKTAC